LPYGGDVFVIIDMLVTVIDLGHRMAIGLSRYTA
jgi:hypothetical protein